MLIVALVLAVIGLAALVTAVVTSNEVVAWVCIGASALGVVLLVVDAIRERQQRRLGISVTDETATAGTDLEQSTDLVVEQTTEFVIYEDDEPSGQRVESEQQAEIEVEDAVDEEPVADLEADFDADLEIAAEVAAEDHPDEVVHDEPEYDTYSDDEQEFPISAEEDAVHPVDEANAEGTDADSGAGAR